jgi:hypothetical protein
LRNGPRSWPVGLGRAKDRRKLWRTEERLDCAVASASGKVPAVVRALPAWRGSHAATECAATVGSDRRRSSALAARPAPLCRHRRGLGSSRQPEEVELGGRCIPVDTAETGALGVKPPACWVGTVHPASPRQMTAGGIRYRIQHECAPLSRRMLIHIVARPARGGERLRVSLACPTPQHLRVSCPHHWPDLTSPQPASAGVVELSAFGGRPSP